MSFPTIPSVTPTINLETGQIINLLLASIAFEELGLAHMINVEAEKLQFVLGHNPDLNQLSAVNRSIRHTLKTVLKQQMLLQFKLEDVLQIPEFPTPTPPPTPCACQVDNFVIHRGTGANDTIVIFNGDILPSNHHGAVDYMGYFCQACTSDNAFTFTYGGTADVPAFDFTATTFKVPGCPCQTVTITGQGTTNNPTLFGSTVTYTLFLNGVINDKRISIEIAGSNGNKFTASITNLGNGELIVSNCT